MAQYIYTMNRVSKVVPPKRTIIKDISLSFFPGAKIGVLGPNGSGWSSELIRQWVWLFLWECFGDFKDRLWKIESFFVNVKLLITFYMHRTVQLKNPFYLVYPSPGWLPFLPSQRSSKTGAILSDRPAFTDYRLLPPAPWHHRCCAAIGKKRQFERD